MSDTLSCSDSCCVFRTEPAAGMVTNGGCRCLSGLTSRQQKFIRDLRRENAELRKRLEQAHAALNIADDFLRVHWDMQTVPLIEISAAIVATEPQK